MNRSTLARESTSCQEVLNSFRSKDVHTKPQGFEAVWTPMTKDSHTGATFRLRTKEQLITQLRLHAATLAGKCLLKVVFELQPDYCTTRGERQAGKQAF